MPPKRKTKLEAKEPPYKLDDGVKQTILTASYIGKKGYTIPKSVIPEKELAFLKIDLYLKPQVSGPAFAQTTDLSFPVYRENPNKIYIPRFYGIERYGIPERNELDDGEDISVLFPRKLRDYQQKIVDVYTSHVSQPNGTKYGGGITEVYCGAGKCLGIDTPVLMYDGTIKMVQNVMVGDILMGDDSTPRTVLTLACGVEQMYKIRDTYSDENYIVNASHILSLKSSINYDRFIKKSSIIDISVRDYFSLKNTLNKYGGSLMGYRAIIDFVKQDIDLDPYEIGFWLGYNNATGNEFISVVERRIPFKYSINSFMVRKRLLRGIIHGVQEYTCDCFDCNDPTSITITELDGYPMFIKDVLFLIRSLGYKVVHKDKETDYPSICIYGTNLLELIVDDVCETNMTDDQCYDIEVTNMGLGQYYGFEIDGNRRFVLGDCTVTHNTVMALKIVEVLQKKTLILVHKEFLMNQWIERIEEFLPGARVGKIQANICDCDNKDIVIGMIQTMYNKTFNQEVYSQFGLTIIDEVHRIGSEEFSKTLLKTITPCMLGISATVERKDKLTKLLHMFIGPKVYSLLRKQDDVVNVRGIEYVTNDTEFNTIEYDFRGNVKFSTMISKLSSFGPRSDFIVRVVHDLLIENPEGQVMVLCHNRCLLTYLYESIYNKGINTVGYYVGGMKQTALEETETKQIVLATYAMAAEALDIKTLSMLVMASPKTDITQSVGRILRVKHNNPVIVDIVDTHELFTRQWLQRKRFYKNSNYPIRYIRSPSYTGMKLDWENDTLWSMLYDPNNKNKSGDIKIGKCMIDVKSV